MVVPMDEHRFSGGKLPQREGFINYPTNLNPEKIETVRCKPQVVIRLYSKCLSWSLQSLLTHRTRQISQNCITELLLSFQWFQPLFCPEQDKEKSNLVEWHWAAWFLLALIRVWWLNPHAQHGKFTLLGGFSPWYTVLINVCPLLNLFCVQVCAHSNSPNKKKSLQTLIYVISFCIL